MCALMVFLAALVGQLHADTDAAKKIDPRAGCATNPYVVGPCFEVRGRAVIGNGTPNLRIVQTGTTRIFGVLPAESEIVPACLAKAVHLASEVTGEFRVCPFANAKEGHMQMVCVESVSEFTVRRWSEEKRAYVVGAQTPGCSLSNGALDHRWRDGMSLDVVDLVERDGGCNHGGGEEPYSAERRKEIEDGAKRLGCDRLDADQRKLRKKYGHRPRVVRVIDVASDYERD